MEEYHIEVQKLFCKTLLSMFQDTLSSKKVDKEIRSRRQTEKESKTRVTVSKELYIAPSPITEFSSTPYLVIPEG